MKVKHLSEKFQKILIKNGMDLDAEVYPAVLIKIIEKIMKENEVTSG